ncbi:replication-relaxation family protein [Francisella philomiragia]|uniref:Replication-relaxation family protein n=1 Tax=Francisella philomiragia TaxID=28110 RepID=A0AAW3DD42_9GAMM|nr:replication-relaxation family protein [Francisella philomiragia]KFJ44123.1 replication-relaxation family protein [Francisella philomiragia]MBK2255685.1 replication-relaxation family protein [Francisella philomiragia]MBK2274004.1 replication-relaxation family protein [Francisella philomiragia]MBK2277845.1 replication-relaxation family protein [Francisella philomiragia]MBK2281791.1 replication-relaxation family protein [Francisella philomiragia]
MILQKRDIEILKFIAKFGYVNSEHLVKMFGLTNPRLTQIAKRLIENDYLTKERLLAKEPAIYHLKQKGAELVKTNKIKPISLQNLKHNLLVIDVYIDLKKKNPGLEILSDREQRAGKFGKMANRAVPDLLILTDEQAGKKNIAIEVELSRKNKQRLSKILAKHSREYLETHYYCNASTFEYLEREAKLKSNVKVYNYFEYEEIPAEIEEALAKVKFTDYPAPQTGGQSSDKLTRIRINGLEKENKELVTRLNAIKSNTNKLKEYFEKIAFKKSTFGGSYTLTAEEQEKLSNLIREL